MSRVTEIKTWLTDSLTDSLTHWVTRSPIELSWTANNSLFKFNLLRAVTCYCQISSTRTLSEIVSLSTLMAMLRRNFTWRELSGIQNWAGWVFSSSFSVMLSEVSELSVLKHLLILLFRLKVVCIIQLYNLWPKWPRHLIKSSENRLSDFVHQKEHFLSFDDRIDDQI